MNHSTTVAPSESHLEQWVIDNPLKLGYMLPGFGFYNLIDQVFASQYKLPSGIVDVIGTSKPGYMRVIELKKFEIDAKTVTQVLRYISDLEVVALMAIGDQYERGQISFEEYKFLAPMHCITGIVVGHAMSDRHLLAACNAANILAVAYRYTGSGYEFECLSDDRAVQSMRITEEYDQHAALRKQFDRIQMARRALLSNTNRGAK